MKLDGKPFDPHAPSPVVREMVKHLESCPHDEVFTIESVARAIGRAVHTIAVYGRTEPLAKYRSGIQGTRVVWGHPKAIAEYRKLTGAK